MSRILIVDDEPTIVELLEEHLQTEGYDTVHAYSGEEALQVFDRFVPDLVILDLMLPGMDGYEVCRVMQNDARLNHIPVIMLTALSSMPNRVRGYERGADDYIIKPFDPDDLSVRVRAQLHHLYHDSISELTGLPGSQAVEGKIKHVMIDGMHPWAILYANISNFTAYNEAHSFFEGDEMIMMAAQSLVAACRESGTPEDFVGHVGGDNFVYISTPEKVDAVVGAAQRIFKSTTADFYAPTDLDQGFFVTHDHQGLLTHATLCSLDFDVVTS